MLINVIFTMFLLAAASRVHALINFPVSYKVKILTDIKIMYNGKVQSLSELITNAEIDNFFKLNPLIDDTIDCFFDPIYFDPTIFLFDCILIGAIFVFSIQNLV